MIAPQHRACGARPPAVHVGLPGDSPPQTWSLVPYPHVQQARLQTLLRLRVQSDAGGGGSSLLCEQPLRTVGTH